MSDAVFHFAIGQFKCMVINDGTLSDDPSSTSASDSRPDADKGQIHGLNCLFVDTGEHKILIDTGCGDGFQTSAGKMLRNLEAASIKRTDIDRIIFTHGHLDHVGGTCDATGKHIFPNARYITSRREWDGWVSRPEKSEMQSMFFASARKNLLAVPERFDLLEDDATEALTGVSAIAAPGHTPGLLVLNISSGESRLLCIGDIIHSPVELTSPEYYAQFDVVPEQALRTRTQILVKAAESGTLVFACHFPFPGLGHIVRKSGVLSWQPLKTAN
jgi:glyoxylase-like metal-dependent hydrolase (beta-lactamase superfamily II)